MLKPSTVVRLRTQVRSSVVPCIRAQYRASYSTSGPSSIAASSSSTSTPSSTTAASSADSPSSASNSSSSNTGNDATPTSSSADSLSASSDSSSNTNIDNDASPASSSSADSASTASSNSSKVDSDAAPSSSVDSPTTSSSSSSSTNDAPCSSSKYPGFNADPQFCPPQPPPRRRHPLSRTLFILGWIPVAAFITSHLYSLGNVTGGSMSPTFNGPYLEASSAHSRSDVVLLNRTLKYRHDELRPGDIVTLISPLDPRLLLTKRIIALPGDTVRVWVTGVGGKGKWTRIKVPPGHVWVEGDAAVDIVPGSLERAANSSSTSPPPLKNKSRDSREFGPVPMGLITSRIEMIVWPPKRFGAPAARPTVAARPSQFPPSTTMAQDRSTQVNPSLARILDEMASIKERSRAHPEDSVISPFVDWDEPNARQEEAVRAKTGSDEDKRKQAWNRSSRGGRLGDDAD